MSFRISPQRSLAEAIRRAAVEEVEGAIACCGVKDAAHRSTVWETRKHLKRARAALSLLKPEVPKRVFHRETVRLRNVARLLSNIRDAEVRLATIKDVRRSFDLRRDRNFEETEELLAFELDSFIAAFAGWQEETASKLSRSQQAITQWELKHVTPKRILRSLRRSYKDGRDALAEVKERGTAPCYHELRKQAKSLRYQLQLLRPLDPGCFKELSRELKRLGADLGHSHDLCFVAERLRDLAAIHPRRRSRKMMLAVLRAREYDLQRRAARIAQRFYAPNSKAFSRCLKKAFRRRPATGEYQVLQRAPVAA